MAEQQLADREVRTKVTHEITVTDPVLPAKVAATFVVPVAIALTSPWVPAAAETVANRGFDDTHLARAVTSPTELSVYVAVALSCCVCPTPKVNTDGSTAMETIRAGVTIRATEPLMAPALASMVVIPSSTDVPRP